MTCARWRVIYGMIDEEQRQHELIYFSGIMVETHVPSHLRFHLLLATRRRLMYVYNCACTNISTDLENIFLSTT